MTTTTAGRGGRRSIRYPILAIAWIPSFALLLIGLLVAGALALQGQQNRAYNTAFQNSSVPVLAASKALFAERWLSVVAVANPAGAGQPLVAARSATDSSLAASLQFLDGPEGRAYPGAFAELEGDLKRFHAELPGVRSRINNRQASLLEVSEFFSAAMDAVARSVLVAARSQPVTAAAVEQSTAVALIRATDQLQDADALALAYYLRGSFSTQEFERFSARLGAARNGFTEVMPLLLPEERPQLKAALESPAARRLDAAYESILGDFAAGTAGKGGRRPEPPMDPAVWGSTSQTVVQQIIVPNYHHVLYASDLARTRGTSELRRDLVVGAVLLLLAVVVFLLTTWASNRLVRRLRRLRSESLALAHVRLPEIMERLQSGKPVDVVAEMPPLRFGRDEIGEVAQAFEEAQRLAVAAAAREAETRAGLRTVFLDIAHRSQAIVHRQLRVLDQAERVQEDPDQLALLFQLDHLSTRARRNAENLIILGGGQAGRQWRQPVPLIEIIRSAISEAEDYVRVQVAGLPRVFIRGSGVADLIHLLAELVDNATSFSPPMSRVEVRGNLVGRGVVVEVEDQGLGIEPEHIDELNRLLQDPPDFQVMALADEPRLGLFVVAQLAARHNIRVTVTPSPAYGGTRVVVLVPTALIATDQALEGSFDEQPSLPRPSAPSLPAPSLPAASVPPPSPPSVLDSPFPEPPYAGAPFAEPAYPDPAEPISPVPPVPGPSLFEAPLRDTGLFEAPLRDTGLFEAPLRESGLFEPGGDDLEDGVVDLRPPGRPPRRVDRDRTVTPDPDPYGAKPHPALPDDLPAPQPDGGRRPMLGEPERVTLLDESIPAPPLQQSDRPALPRRHRQTHLSPKLRDLPDEAPAATDEPSGVPDAEVARNRMAALQRGTLRGRATDPETDQ